MRFLSPDGISFAFDERANGYARGEGFGVFILKRISDAIRDNDNIRAVIRNTACNQDGRSPSITQPMTDAQVALIRKAYNEVGLDLHSTRYFEAHATGTAVGDPAEMKAISEVFSEYRSPEDPMYVGALKTSIGHLEGAAGLASLMKSVHILEQGVIPGNLWFNKLNPNITIDTKKFRFPVAPQAWTAEGPRRISINAFGFGGTNVHVILEDASSYLNSHGWKGYHRTIGLSKKDTFMTNGFSHRDERTEKLFVISAPDEAGLKRLSHQYLQYLQSVRGTVVDEGKFLDDLAFTLSQRRTLFPWRSAVVESDLESLVRVLDGSPRSLRATVSPSLSFVFTGQGAQWPQMGKELLSYPVFKESLRFSSSFLRRLNCPWFLLEEILKDDSVSNISDPEFSQPATTALQIALVELLASWSIRPSTVLGHSSGEIAAAYTAGAISKEAALRIAFFRGSLSAKLAHLEEYPKGTMLAVALGSVQVAPYLDEVAEQTRKGSLTVACINSPINVTVSGGVEAIEALQNTLKAQNIFCRKLRVNNGFHSQYMSPMAKEYHELIGTIPTGSSDGTTSFFSSFRGAATELKLLRDPQYWVGNLLSPVLFSDALSALLETQARLKTSPPNIVEIGPHAALHGPIREVAESRPSVYHSMLKRGKSAMRTVLGAVGALHTLGVPVDVSTLNTSTNPEHTGQLLADLPSYPFDHSHTYWNESRISRSYRFRKVGRHDLLGAPAPDWNPANAIWTNRISISENPWIKDLQLNGVSMYPATGVLAMVIEACKQLAHPETKLKGFRFRNVAFTVPILVPNTSEGLEARLYVRDTSSGIGSRSDPWHEYELWSYDEEWTCHSRGQVLTEYVEENDILADHLDGKSVFRLQNDGIGEAQLAPRDREALDSAWARLERYGVRYGNAFRNISDVCSEGDSSASCTLTAPSLDSIMPHGHVQSHLIHPTMLDGAIVAALIASSTDSPSSQKNVMPKLIDEFWISAERSSPIESLRISAKARTSTSTHVVCDLIGSDLTSSRPVFEIKGLVHGSTGVNADIGQASTQHDVCFTEVSKPDPDLLELNCIPQNIDGTPEPLPVVDTELARNLELLRFAYLKRYATRHASVDVDSSQQHYRKYVLWIHHILSLHKEGHLQSIDPDWPRLAEDDAFILSLEQELEQANPEGKMTVIIGRLLPKILSGEVNPLEILFSDKLVENAYRAQPGAEFCLSALGRFVDLLGHKNPNLNIVEVGAGTGAATNAVVSRLAPSDGGASLRPCFARYDFTDLSTAFLQNAREEFSHLGNHMRYGLLNIEQDPVEQDYEAGLYDVFIAANVLHATRSIDQTLKNARKLLKPGGKLILHELTSPQSIGAGLGLHEEPYREWSPLLTIDGWDLHLRRNGFSGVDLSFDDIPDAASHQHSLMIATAVADCHIPTSVLSTPVTVVLNGLSSVQAAVGTLLKADVESSGLKCELNDLAIFQPQAVAGTLCVSLAGWGESLRDDRISDGLFDLCSFADQVLLLTPNNDRFSGLKTTDRDSPKLMKLSMRQDSSPEAISSTIWKLLKSITKCNNTPKVSNVFAGFDQIIHIPRLAQATDLNQRLSETLGPKVPQPFRLQGSSALVVRTTSPGSLDSLHFTHDEDFEKPLTAKEVELQVEAATLDQPNVRESLGELTRKHRGFGVAGIVTRTGSRSKFTVGDRVCGMSLGEFGTVTRSNDDALVKTAEQLTLTSAAYSVMAFVVAHAALHNYGRIRKGDKILVNGGSYGLISACVQIAHLAEAEVYIIADSKAQRDVLAEEHILPDTQIICKGSSAADQVMQLTGGSCVDVVVNSLSSIAADRGIECLAPFGKFVDVRPRAADGLPQFELTRVKDNTTISFLDPYHVSAGGPALVGETLQKIMRLVEDGKLQAKECSRVYSLSQIQDAFRLVLGGDQSETVMMRCIDGEEIMAITRPTPLISLDCGGAYVILGESDPLLLPVAHWMVERGARDLWLFSRAELEISTLNSFKAKGVQVTVRVCDSPGIETLKREMAAISPPLKGIVHCTASGTVTSQKTMFSDEAIQTSSPFDHFVSSLHGTPPTKTDFFIIIKSSTTVAAKHDENHSSVADSFRHVFSDFRTTSDQTMACVDLSDIMSFDETTKLSATQEQQLFVILDEVSVRSSDATKLSHGVVALKAETLDAIQDNGSNISWLQDPLFSHIRNTRRVQHQEPCAVVEQPNFRGELRAATSYEAAAAVVSKAIEWKICQALGTQVQLDMSRPLNESGVDSLVAVELRSWLEKELGAKVSTGDIVGNDSLEKLVGLVAKGSSVTSFR